MTSTSTPGTGLPRLFNLLAALALLFVVAGGASAQKTIFVDPNGGSDARNGLQRNLGTGNVGPKESIEGALAIAASGDTVVLLAGVYDDSRGVVAGGAEDGRITIDGVNNLTIQASPEGTQTRVVFAAPIDLFSTGHTFTREGTATFALADDLVVGQNGTGGALDNPGSANLGSGIFALGQNQSGTASGAYTVAINEGSLSGTPVVTSAPAQLIYAIDGPATTYTAGAELPATGFGSTIIVDFDAAASGTLTIPANVRLTGGATVSVADADRIAGGFEVAGGTGAVTFDDGGSYGAVTVTSGTLNIDDNLSVMSITLNGGTTDATGQTLTVMGSFVQNNGLFAAGGSLEFDGSTAAATFQPQSNLVVAGLSIGDGTAPEPSSVTFAGDVTVAGLFSVADGTTANLSGNSVRLQGAGADAVVDGTVADGLVVIRDAAQTIGGSGSYDSIALESFTGGPVSIAAGSDLVFTGDLALAGSGGLAIPAGATISPSGDDASVSINIDAANGITGDFNSDGEEYDLSYFEAQNAAGDLAITFTVGQEFDLGEIENLSVTATNATIDATAAAIPAGAGAEILGNFTVGNGDDPLTTAATVAATERVDVNLPAGLFEVAGTTTIEDNAVVTAAGAGLALAGTNNILDGVIDGSTLVLRNGVTVSGRATTATSAANSATAAGTVSVGQSEARIEADVLLANGASASLLNLRRIDGDITDEAAAAANAGTLTIGLVADSNPTGQADAGQPDFQQDTNGNINGQVTLDFSTLTMASSLQFTDASAIRIATLNTGSFVFFTESVQAAADLDNTGGPTALTLTNDVQGTGTVWPSSNLTISKTGTAPQTLTIPVFHPGDDDEDVITIASNILVTRTLRITGTLDADANDAGTIDYAVTVDGVADDVATVIVDAGYAITEDVDAAGVTDNELIVNGPINLTTSETGVLNPFTQNVLLGAQDVRTFMVMGAASLAGTDDDRTADYTVEDFVTTAAGSLDLNGFDLAVRDDATLASDNALRNTAVIPGGTRVDANGLVQTAFSTFSFIGDSTATLTVTPNTNTGVATFGDGVDLRIAKATVGTTVNLVGGSLVFDDEFNGGAASDDDETLVLERGILDVAEGSYIRLDHANSIAGSSTSDNGQGFVFVPADTDFPNSWINGDVRKRIISVPSTTTAGRQNPGRVVYPVGADSAGTYAEYVLDFESITQSQSFGQRSVTVRFVDESPGGGRGLPIDYDGGTPADASDDSSIDDVGNFYWLVQANPNLGSGTFFNVEARYDGYELRTNTTNGEDELVSDLVLLQRQFGNAAQNPYSLVSDTFANFIIERGDDQNPVVVAQNVEALLGGQGTIFTFGLEAANRRVDNEDGPTVLPTAFTLKGSAPNPFRGRTTLSFDLPQAADVSVAVFDVMGRQVMSLDQGTMAPGADQSIEIDGNGLASGVYVFRLTAVGADNSVETRAGQITLAR